MVCAAFRVSSSSCSAGMTRATRPDFSASAASIMRAVRHRVHRLGLADGARQALRAAGPGQGAEADFRLAELGGVGSVDHVAHHRHFAAAAQGKTGHGGDHRLAGRLDALPVAGDEVGLVGMQVVEILHEADIGPGGEGLFIAGDDDAADVLVGFEGVDGGADAVNHLVVQGVHRLRAVDADQADLADDLARVPRGTSMSLPDKRPPRRARHEVRPKCSLQRVETSAIVEADRQALGGGARLAAEDEALLAPRRLPA